MWRSLSLRGKLVATGVIVQLAAFALLTWNSADLIDNYLRSELHARAERDAPLLNAAFAAPMLQRDYATVQAIIVESRAKQGMSYLIVCDAAGRAVGQDGWPAGAPKPDTTLPQPVRADDGSRRFDFKSPLTLEGRKLGVMHFGLSGTFIEEARGRLLQRTVLVGVGVLAASLLLLALVAYWLTLPLQRLTAASRQIRSGDYDVRLQAAGGDEVGVLTEDFRNMAAEIKRRVAELQAEHAALEAARVIAETASQAKSDFLAKMSHEIRTPMHGILGMVELLKAGTLSDSQRERGELVRRSGEALLGVVNDVLDFSKIQVGKLSLEIVAYRPGDLVQDMISLYLPRAAAKGVQLAAEVLPGAPLVVYGDPARLRQVLGNLLSNAVKFTSQGAISLRVRGVEGAEPEAARLLFEVEDTGLGVAPEFHERIFEPFAQADDSTTRRFGGTGLGLAISRQLVALMGGELTITSVPGKGSTFRVELPAPPAPEEDALLAMPSTVPTDLPVSIDCKVLLAEDNRVNQILARTILDRLGCTVKVAVNGKDAVTAYAADGFDLVLMDCHMPEMDGYEAARRIREIEAGPPARGKRVPIIAVTANALPGERDRCLAAGMDDYLAKPFRAEDIATLIRKWWGA